MECQRAPELLLSPRSLSLSWKVDVTLSLVWFCMVSDLCNGVHGMIGWCSTMVVKLHSDLGLGRLAVSMWRLRPISVSTDRLPSDSIEVLACSACSESAFTTAFIVLLSLPSSSSSSSSWWATILGLIPILFNLKVGKRLMRTAD